MKSSRDNKSKTKLWWAIFIIFVMLSSSAAFVWNSFSNTNGNVKDKATFNGYKFKINSNGIWETIYKGQTFEFYYLPDQLNDISLNDITINEQKVYISYNASVNDQYTALNMQRLRLLMYLNNIMGIASCIEEKNCPDIPVVDCDGSNKVIYLKLNEDNIGRIETLENCIVISGNSIAMNKAVEKLIYRMMDII
ncbi:MAG: hypothetical protein AABW41_00420 [Nanoarchaeota archaeon]|mgnify:FL=1